MIPKWPLPDIDRAVDTGSERISAAREITMSEYELYCFAQSGNAYRAALMLNLIGADWKPIYVDFFAKGETRTPEYRADVNEMGEVPVLEHGAQEAQPVGRDPDLPRRTQRQIPAARAKTSASKRCAGSSSTIRRSTAFSGPYRFLKNWAKPAPDPAVVAFLKGRIDAALAVVNKRLASRAVPARRAADHRRHLDVRIPVLSGRRSSASTSPRIIRRSAHGSSASRRCRAGGTPTI